MLLLPTRLRHSFHADSWYRRGSYLLNWRLRNRVYNWHVKGAVQEFPGCNILVQPTVFLNLVVAVVRPRNGVSEAFAKSKDSARSTFSSRSLKHFSLSNYRALLLHKADTLLRQINSLTHIVQFLVVKERSHWPGNAKVRPRKGNVSVGFHIRYFYSTAQSATAFRALGVYRRIIPSLWTCVGDFVPSLLGTLTARPRLPKQSIS